MKNCVICGVEIKNHSRYSVKCRSCAHIGKKLSDVSKENLSCVMRNRMNSGYAEYLSRVNSVQISYKPNKNGCFICTSHDCTEGRKYPRICIMGRRVLLHRWIYEMAVGGIGKKDVIMHSCDDRRCINPAHLVAATQYDNLQDAVNKRRHSWGSKNGHVKLTEDGVREIRKSSGVSQRELARKYGVSQSAIWLIKAGKNWRLLEEVKNDT